MHQTANHLLEIIEKALPLLQAISDADAELKPSPTKWSNKEIIGHLIDSACNNQQKFVRTMAAKHVEFVGYEQNHWVASQQYNLANWQELLQFWASYNRHIAHIIAHASAENLSNTITIGTHGTYTLEFIMQDYPEHLKHHLKQILPTNDFLQNNFSNDVYFK